MSVPRQAGISTCEHLRRQQRLSAYRTRGLNGVTDGATPGHPGPKQALTGGHGRHCDSAHSFVPRTRIHGPAAAIVISHSPFILARASWRQTADAQRPARIERDTPAIAYETWGKFHAAI